MQTLGGSGVYFKDVLLSTFKPVPNHPNGGFYGPRSTGENFRRLLEVHPVYIDPMSSLAGAYMANFMSYRTVPWNPDFDCTELLAEHAKYQTIPAIGGVQHMCQDMEMGLKLGWGGVLAKSIATARQPPGGRFLCRPGTRGSGDSGFDSPPRPCSAPHGRRA